MAIIRPPWLLDFGRDRIIVSIVAILVAIAWASSFRRGFTITHFRHITLGRTPLDE
jgi:hypothetical protein